MYYIKPLSNNDVEISIFERDGAIPYEGEINFIKPKINSETKELYEGATEEEIAELKKQNKLLQMQNFLTNKKADGEAYYNKIELALTIVLAGLPIQSLIPVNHEIETLIKPIINEIIMGDWFNAYMKLWITEDYTRPQSNLIMETFDNIKVQVKQYFENNYPR
ncbi:MAG TPA: hypothetical protein DDZ41_07895 [Flavobacterium sp.]|nr:hypothetical protein [Flavobacterium sp.]